MGKWISRKKTPPSYTDFGGPRIVEFHSYRLSPLGPALRKTNKKKDINYEASGRKQSSGILMIFNW